MQSGCENYYCQNLPDPYLDYYYDTHATNALDDQPLYEEWLQEYKWIWILKNNELTPDFLYLI